MPKKRIDFTKEAIQEYLDTCIIHWRNEKDKHVDTDPVALYYIDALQSVRYSILGKTLPIGD
jgi:hypothetical protein